MKRPEKRPLTELKLNKNSCSLYRITPETQQMVEKKRKTKKYKLYEKSIAGSGGVLQVIATRVGSSRSAVGHYLSQNPEIALAVEDEGERMIDVAENRLFSRLENNDWKAIDRVLKSSKASKRGWSERQEIENIGEQFNNIKLEIIDKTEDVRKDTPND